MASLSSVFPAALLAVAAQAQAALLEGEVTDQAGRPVADAVVAATPAQGKPPAAKAPPIPKGPPATVVLDQRNREFIPHVLAIRSGTEVSFPNSDRIQHHVYSFSPAKRFEIKLYKGTPPNPIRFDKPGIAVLGCNIHDWMVSYIYVADTAYFTKTDGSGRWSLEVPSNPYTLSIWHPDMQPSEGFTSAPLTPAEGRSIRLDRAIGLKRAFRPGKPPASLQEQVYRGDP